MNKASDTTLVNFLERFDVRVHRLPNKSAWIAGSEGTIAVGSTVREALRNLREEVLERCRTVEKINDAFKASRTSNNIDKKENTNG